MSRKWTIDKSFSFCFGHRVHNQVLNDKSLTDGGDCSCVCRHLHGHEGLVKVFLESDELTNGMVTDFKNLGWFKNFLDDVLDHKFVMDINDPLIGHEAPELCSDDMLDFSKLNPIHNEGYYVPNLSLIDKTKFNGALYEKYEGMIFVNFVPTSENLCSWFMDIANAKMEKVGIKVASVEYWETPKSHCKITT